MPLPTHLNQSLRAAQPNMIRLSTDDLAQLKAYLGHPDRFLQNIGRLYEERDNPGGGAHHQEYLKFKEFHRYLRMLRDYNSGLPKNDQTKKNKRGRRTDTDVNGDRRIYEAWKSGHYRTYADLALELSRDVRDVILALGRHRKRIAAQE